MAEAYDAFSRPGSGTGVAGNQSWTHTPVGTPRGVKVYVIYGTNTGVATVTVTYGGTSLSQTTSSPNNKTTTETMEVFLFTLYSSIPTGAQTVAITTSNGTDQYSAGCITTTAGADTEFVDDDNSINSSSVADPSATLNLGGKTCFCCIGFASGQNAITGITPLTNWTSRSEEDLGGQTAGIYTYDTVGSTNVTAGWTQTAEDACAIPVATAEVAAAGGRIFKLAGDGGGLAGDSAGLAA